MKPYIVTASGEHFDFVDMSQNVINIKDIAHALSMKCRFGGHCAKFYSVAQHSVIVSHLVDPEIALSALLHDASEAYLVDVPTPLKHLLPDYQVMERRIEDYVDSKLGTNTHDPRIKYADLQALGMEKRDLMPFDRFEWSCLDGIEIPDFKIKPMLPDDAYSYFQHRYHELIDKTQLNKPCVVRKVCNT